MIAIAGYASKTGTKSENQQLSEDRAEAVATYLRDQKNIPMRRILAPAGYGTTHPDATNTDAQGRELNRRVDVTLIVNNWWYVAFRPRLLKHCMHLGLWQSSVDYAVRSVPVAPRGVEAG